MTFPPNCDCPTEDDSGCENSAESTAGVHKVTVGVSGPSRVKISSFAESISPITRVGGERRSTQNSCCHQPPLGLELGVRSESGPVRRDASALVDVTFHIWSVSQRTIVRSTTMRPVLWTIWST